MKEERGGSGAHAGKGVDFDLRGIVGIRLLGATAADERAVARQLGPIRGTLERDPDIVVRFVDRLDLGEPLRLLGLDDVGFTRDAFVVLKGKSKSRVRVRVPIDRIGAQIGDPTGGPLEIVSEHSPAAVPLLIQTINATALAKGFLPLHAAAFVHRGVGVVATGWSKGGKTETLLSFMVNGATYVGDEWTYFSPDGEHMYGIPEPIRLWRWHLEELPQVRARIPKGRRARLDLLAALGGGLQRFTGDGKRHASTAARTANRVSSLIRRQLYVDVAPERLFGNGRSQPSARPDKFLFVATHDHPDIVVRRMDPSEIARRMVFSLQEEEAPLATYYRKYRFAFPDRANPVLERTAELQRDALERVLAGKEAYEVLHPYPVSLPGLYEAVAAVCA